MKTNIPGKMAFGDEISKPFDKLKFLPKNLDFIKRFCKLYKSKSDNNIAKKLFPISVHLRFIETLVVRKWKGL